MTGNRRVILCYGDSHTYGTVPLNVEETHVSMRYDYGTRWTGRLQNRLGESVIVVEEGLPGRTTSVDDPVCGKHKNGLTYLKPCLETHHPIDWIILMLGTNDLKSYLKRTVVDIGCGVEKLLDVIMSVQRGPTKKMPEVLLIVPPYLKKTDISSELFREGVAKSRRLTDNYKRIADKYGIGFLNASDVLQVSDVDGIHFEADAHEHLASAIYDKYNGVFISAFDD